MTPRVFVSHASEDKQRFVVKFAQRLRENGVDAWLDQWEMKPGDSLVDKIFEEGLKEATAVVIVLSAVSVRKPWVREELNTSVVNRISRGLKIIPVVIDHCEIPLCLQATLWQRIDDPEHYDDEFQRVLDAIFDRSTKPPLGQPPQRLAQTQPDLPSLTATDQQVLSEIYRATLDSDVAMLSELRQIPALSSLSESDLTDSAEVLEKQGYLKLEGLGSDLAMRLTTDGFRRYAEAAIADYEPTLDQLAGLLVNEGVFENIELAKRLALPQRYVNLMLDVLADADAIVLSKYGSGVWEIVRVTPSLKRSLG
jgi:hypothetical protein